MPRCGEALTLAFLPPPALGTYIDLAHNTALRTLHLIITDLRDHLMPWVPALLRQAAGASLERLTLEMWLNDGRQLASPWWDAVAALLDQPCFAGVREVLVMHRGDLSMDVTAGSMENRFPELARRHVLRVTDVSPFLAGRIR